MITEAKIDETHLIYQTHCWYCPEGQIIIVERDEHTHATYCIDVSRGIPFKLNESRIGVYFIHPMYLNDEYEVWYDHDRRERMMELYHENKHLVPHNRK